MKMLKALILGAFFISLAACSEAVVNINVNSKKQAPSAGPGFSSGSPRTILTSTNYKLAAQVQGEAQTVLTSISYRIKANPVVVE